MSTDHKDTIPWVEKYRPQTIDEVAQQEEVCAALRSSLKTGELPNLMFYGPPGTGKTTVALALVQQHFGDSWRSRVKELNASDDRGINAVREKVKTFAQLAIGTADKNLADKKGKFRVVILDEADSMTHDAQAALRRIMEEFVHVTRFIIICNYVSKIIEPLHSRCSKFRFAAIDPDFQKKRLNFICEKEGITIPPRSLDLLTSLSKGDMRCAVTMLQTSVGFYGAVTEEALTELACAVPEKAIEDLLKKTKTAPSSDEVIEAVREFLKDGYSGLAIMEELLNKISQDNSLSDLQKAKCAILFSQVDERLTAGCDEEMQLFAMFSTMRPLLKQK